MKTRYFAVLLTLLAVARGEPEYVGVLSSNEAGKRFVVTPSVGAAPRWIKIGDEIDGYIVSDSREGDDILVLKKDGHEVALRMKGARVQHADYGGTPMSVAAAKQLIAGIAGWESDVMFHVFQRKDGGWSLSAARRVGKALQMRFVPVTPQTAPK
jgi:hypothetical protein